MESDSIEHGKGVLAAALRGPREVMDRLMAAVVPEYFPDVQQQTVWRFAEEYYTRTGVLLTREAVADLLRAEPAGTVIFFQEYLDALLKRPLEPDSHLSWRVEQLRAIYAERRTGEALARGMEVLRRGVAEKNGDVIRGHQAAREQVLSAFGDIDRTWQVQSAPEGDMRGEYQALVEDYQARKSQALNGAGRIPTGIPRLDRMLGGGWANGELDLIAGYTSSGKTSVCVQCAWHASVICGKNVVILTSETLRDQIRLKLLARHSRISLDPRWRDKGLDSSLIKSGHLDADSEMFYLQAARDLTGNPGYGALWIAQIPRGSTIATLEQHLIRLSRLFPADLVIIDYLQLLRADRRRQSKREELADIMQEAKLMAASYMDGRGVPVISPWQMSRDGFRNALTRGHYTLTDLADTNEAGATADAVFTLLAPELPGNKRAVAINARLAKNRDGDTGGVFELTGDYATCHFAETVTGAGDQAATSSPFADVLGG